MDFFIHEAVIDNNRGADTIFVARRRKVILIIYGYHPKEKFAVRVGEGLARRTLSESIKIVRYRGRADRGKSTYYLRKFIARFSPEISLVLHDTDNLHTYSAALVYCTPYRLRRKRALRHLFDFIIKQADKQKSSWIFCGWFFTPCADRSFIDVELNPRTGFRLAEKLVDDFSQYLLELISFKKLKL